MTPSSGDFAFDMLGQDVTALGDIDTKVHAQGFFRDPVSSGGAGISTALVFTVAP